jgi:CBS domain-containing protein
MRETILSILRNKSNGNAIWHIDPGATVFEAIAMMADKSVGALLVMAEGRLVGIITERDYARKVFLLGRSSKETRISEIMSSELITVSPEATVDECMRIMTQYRIRHLPVLDGERVAGILSIGDLVNSIISAQAQTIEHLHKYIGGNYPN